MQLTKSQAKLIEDAKTAGYTVTVERTSIDLIKRGGRWNKITSGLRICEDGTAFRLDISAGCTTTIRTQKVMREVLGV